MMTMMIIPSVFFSFFMSLLFSFRITVALAFSSFCTLHSFLLFLSFLRQNQLGNFLEMFYYSCVIIIIIIIIKTIARKRPMINPEKPTMQHVSTDNKDTHGTAKWNLQPTNKKIKKRNKKYKNVCGDKMKYRERSLFLFSCFSFFFLIKWFLLISAFHSVRVWIY